MLHKFVECYVDNLVVKLWEEENHLENLRRVFEWLCCYQLKMNHLKCAFGVTSSKFLGFIVCKWGIKIDQAKVDTNLNMPEPHNVHEARSLQKRLAYLRRLISNLVGRYQPFSQLIRKDVPFE